MRAFLVELLKDDALQLLDRGGMSKAAMAGGHDQLGLCAAEVGTDVGDHAVGAGQQVAPAPPVAEDRVGWYHWRGRVQGPEELGLR